METPIQRTMATIREGTISRFRQLLDEHPGLLEEHGPHLLEYAATNNRTDILEFLIGAGVDVNAAIHLDTPLSATAREGDVETARWLLDHGADVNGRAGPRGDTPLEAAVVEGRLEMVELLMERGADPDILHGSPGRNALASARFWGHDDIADYLEGRGVAEVVVEPEPVDVEAHEFLAAGEGLSPLEWYERTWGHVSEYATRHGLDALGERNRVLFLVGYLVDQLANGGASQLYANPSAEYAPDVAVALERIGASTAARIVRALNALSPGGAPARVPEVRWEQFRSLPPEAAKLGDELEALLDERQPDTGEPTLLAQLYEFYHS